MDWIAAMKRVGLPVAFKEIIQRQHDLRRAAEAHKSQSVDTTDVWMVLALPWSSPGARTTHCLEHRESAKRRGEVVSWRDFQHEGQSTHRDRIDLSRVYNMDETLCTPKLLTCTVVGSKGSKTCGRSRSSSTFTFSWWPRR